MFKVGFSKDIHKLKSGKGFMLGSFFIECKKTVDAYSDGDVIWHSLTEALLGAMGLEDLGTYYKPEFYVRGFDSIIMIKETLEKLKKRNYRISNIDITIQLDEPSLKETKKLIKQNMAKILEISENDISLKATTSEGTLLNSIVCYSSVLIYKEEKKMKKYRLRYAPSPTGFLHIGNTRTALMNYLFAKHYDGNFIVRIEDTDLERNVDGAIDSQFDNLKWLGIIPDESFLNPKEVYGEYMQSRKFQIYKDMAMKLVNEGKAYKCYCTPEQLELERNRQLENGILAPKYAGTCRTLKNDENDKDYNIRFKVPENKIYKINDLVRGLVEFDSKEIGDFVILKTNGIATYNFAVVVDDYDMKISHVVRGEEHISNTPRQCMIYEAFNWDMPVFSHLTLIVDDTKKKLSKRSGNSLFFISQYREKGYLPEAIFNYISLLGWSPSGEQEIFERNELINIFDEKRFSKSPSTFDVMKLKWINSQWMKKLTEEEYLSFTKKFIDKEKFDIDSKKESWLNDVLLLFKKELEFGAQINAHLNMFFDSQHINEETLKQLSDFSDYKIMLHDFKEKLKSLVTFDENEIKSLIKDMGIKHNRKGKDLFMPLRICSTLSEHGPELAKTIMLIGRDNVIKNIESLV